MALLEEYIAKEVGGTAAAGRGGPHARRSLPAGAVGACRGARNRRRYRKRPDKLALNICLSYGARAELARAARRLAEQVQRGALEPAQIDEDALAAELYTAAWPDPDLLIRTSGEMRLSNFLLWQLAYAEIVVTPVRWPDFTRDDLHAAIAEFQSRDRRFGRVNA